MVSHILKKLIGPAFFPRDFKCVGHEHLTHELGKGLVDVGSATGLSSPKMGDEKQ